MFQSHTHGGRSSLMKFRCWRIYMSVCTEN